MRLEDDVLCQLQSVVTDQSPDDAQINLSVTQFRITPDDHLNRGSTSVSGEGLSLVSLPDDSMMVR